MREGRTRLAVVLLRKPVSRSNNHKPVRRLYSSFNFSVLTFIDPVRFYHIQKIGRIEMLTERKNTGLSEWKLKIEQFVKNSL